LRQVFVNAGPLIALGKLNRLHLLVDLYEIVHIPRAVYREVVVEGTTRGLPDALPIRLFVEVRSLPILEASQEALLAYSPAIVLDAGESELLALAREFKDALVLMDDADARVEARRLGLAVKGTLGILVEACRAGILSFPETEVLILEIAARPDIWISETLCRQVLQQLVQDSGSSPAAISSPR
jgi:predicted nucleic acid-binding protein